MLIQNALDPDETDPLCQQLLRSTHAAQLTCPSISDSAPSTSKTGGKMSTPKPRGRWSLREPGSSEANTPTGDTTMTVRQTSSVSKLCNQIQLFANH